MHARLLTKMFVASVLPSAYATVLEINKLTWLETNAIVSVIDARVSNDHVITPVYIPSIRVLSLILRSRHSRYTDVAVRHILTLIHQIDPFRRVDHPDALNSDVIRLIDRQEDGSCEAAVLCTTPKSFRSHL